MDVKKSCAAVIKRVIFIGFCIQIFLGILWMCNAFAGMHNFGEGIVCVGQILLLSGTLWLLLPRDTVWRTLFRVLSVESFPMILQLLAGPDLRILMVVLLLVGWMACRKRVGLACICVTLAIGIGFFLTPEKDLLALSSSRIVWTTLYHDYYLLENDTADKIDYMVMSDSTLKASGIETILLPTLREEYPEEEVRELMGALMKVAWKTHPTQIMKEIVWDESGYVLPPIILILQLEHRAYDSCSGLNYRQFLQVAPQLSRHVMRYGCFWFVAAMILRLLLLLLENSRSYGVRTFLYAAITLVAMSVWYTFSTTGRMDYKNVIYILCLWLFWMTDGATFWEKEAASDAAYTEEK